MSIFNPVTLACPHCGKPVEFLASASVNADRRPDLREAILDGSFQRAACPHCGTSFRVEPQLNYLDVGRGQWIAAFPGGWVDQWPDLEGSTSEVFDKAFGSGASAAEREIGENLRPRMVFGWWALREKLLAADAGLDDASLELTKMALMRSLTDPPLADGQQLRLVEIEGKGGADDTAGTGSAPAAPGAEPGSFVLLVLPDAATAPGDTAAPPEELRVPRAVLEDIEAEPEDWQPLRTAVTAGLFVDVMRLTRGPD